jgi:hypothetical protein
MIEEFERLFEQTRPAFSQERTFARARTLAMSALVGLGRRTISGLLCTSAQQFTDWSAAYRLFERERFDREALFDPVVCVKLCKKVFMVSVTAQAAIFKSSFFCSANRVMLR